MLNEPLYIQIIRDIQEKIKTGFYKSDSFIPSEGDLQEIYRMSRTTVRRAISELINSGYLMVVKGVGTKVMPSRLMTRPQELISFTQLMRSQGVKPGTKMLSVEICKGSAELQKSLEHHGDFIKISRLRTADGTPISINTSYLPASLLHNRNRDIFNAYISLYEILEKEFNVKISVTEDTYSAIIADGHLANTLTIRKGDPLLMIERTAFDQKQKPVEYSIIYLRADRYRHTITLRVS
ncbi:MAG: GntR family transcriptional regulator [Anaerolineaceae bacterium]|nr:GntR family transcriptional regulator [Anaerolineaceae bacterium]